MTHTKRKLAVEEIESFRKFLERRGFKCRNGKGRDQLLQVKNTEGSGQHIFTKNSKDEVIYPPMFDALIQVFRALVDPVPELKVIDRSTSHDSDLLDDFAIAAMQGMLSGDKGWYLMPASLSIHSYEIAKAMMAERAKHQPK